MKLTHHRWCIPLLAWFSDRGDAKFVTLAHHLGIGRGALSSSLKHLIALGLVTRNTGHGHPLRPEYLLVKNAQVMANACRDLDGHIQSWDSQSLAYRKWSLPLVMAVGPTQQRFTDLKHSLNPISPRALALGLQQLERGAWISRAVTHHYPPVAQYSLRSRGRLLLSSTISLMPTPVT